MATPMATPMATLIVMKFTDAVTSVGHVIAKPLIVLQCVSGNIIIVISLGAHVCIEVSFTESIFIEFRKFIYISEKLIPQICNISYIRCYYTIAHS